MKLEVFDSVSRLWKYQSSSPIAFLNETIESRAPVSTSADDCFLVPIHLEPQIRPDATRSRWGGDRLLQVASRLMLALQDREPQTLRIAFLQVPQGRCPETRRCPPVVDLRYQKFLDVCRANLWNLSTGKTGAKASNEEPWQNCCILPRHRSSGHAQISSIDRRRRPRGTSHRALFSFPSQTNMATGWLIFHTRRCVEDALGQLHSV